MSDQDRAEDKARHDARVLWLKAKANWCYDWFMCLEDQEAVMDAIATALRQRDADIERLRKELSE